MALKFYTSVTMGLKRKARSFVGAGGGVIFMFVEVKGKKLVGGGLFTPSPILNRVNGIHENI